MKVMKEGEFEGKEGKGGEGGGRNTGNYRKKEGGVDAWVGW